MDRASILKEIRTATAQLSTAQAKLSDLQAAKTAVSGVSTSVSYKIEDPGHLEGTKYSEQEQNERDILTTAKKSMDSKKETVLADLDVKISQAQTQVDNVNSTLRVLFIQLEHAKD